MLPSIDHLRFRRTAERTTVRARRGFRFAALLLIGMAAVAGCGLPALSNLSGDRPGTQLSYEYLAQSGDGYMNQYLTISNHGTDPVAPILAFQALDGDGRILPEVVVTTVFGSDYGKVVAPARAEVGDVLIFEGTGSQSVADVAVDARLVEQVDFPEIDTDVEVIPLDAAGRSVTRNDLFRSVELRNDHATLVTVRLVYIVWTVPPPDRTQQAERVYPIGDLIMVPPNGSMTVPVEGEARTAIEQAAGIVPASVKVYYSR